MWFFVMWKEAFGLTALRQGWGQEPGHGAGNGDIAEAATVTPVTTGMIAQQVFSCLPVACWEPKCGSLAEHRRNLGHGQEHCGGVMSPGHSHPTIAMLLCSGDGDWSLCSGGGNRLKKGFNRPMGNRSTYHEEQPQVCPLLFSGQLWNQGSARRLNCRSDWAAALRKPACAVGWLLVSWSDPGRRFLCFYTALLGHSPQ